MNTMASIYFYELEKLEYIKEGNRLPNYKTFIKDVMSEMGVNRLYELWKQERGEKAKRSIFDHELGTLLLNAKFYSENQMFGMAYGNLAVVTYVNNSSPNLLEFSVIKSIHA